MACELTLWDSTRKTKTTVVCDEENAAKVIADEHAAKASGQYVDVEGKTFSADWTTCRLIRFNRTRAEN